MPLLMLKKSGEADTMVKSRGIIIIMIFESQAGDRHQYLSTCSKFAIISPRIGFRIDYASCR